MGFRICCCNKLWVAFDFFSPLGKNTVSFIVSFPFFFFSSYLSYYYVLLLCRCFSFLSVLMMITPLRFQFLFIFPMHTIDGWMDGIREVSWTFPFFRILQRDFSNFHSIHNQSLLLFPFLFPYLNHIHSPLLYVCEIIFSLYPKSVSLQSFCYFCFLTINYI